MAVRVKEDVLGLQVAINDVVFVKVLDGQDQLRNVELGPLLLKFAVLLQMPEQLAARHVIGDLIEVGRRLERKLEADNEGRVGHCRPDENVALANRVSNFLLLDNDLLGQDLHGINPSSVLLSYLVDLA